MDVLRPARAAATVSDADLARLREMQLEDIWSALGEYRVNYVRGFRSTQPGERIAGRALTMRFLPPPPRLRHGRRHPRRGGRLGPPLLRAGRGRGAARGRDRGPSSAAPAATCCSAEWGALGIKLRGAAGVVIDGGSRDLAELASDAFLGFPVFARFFDVKTTSWLGAAWNTPVRIGTATVLPGDVVVADDTGVLFFPAGARPPPCSRPPPSAPRSRTTNEICSAAEDTASATSIPCRPRCATSTSAGRASADPRRPADRAPARRRSTPSAAGGLSDRRLGEAPTATEAQPASPAWMVARFSPGRGQDPHPPGGSVTCVRSPRAQSGAGGRRAASGVASAPVPEIL